MTAKYKLTDRANQQLDELRGEEQLAVADFLDQVKAEGCAALGYRLSGEYPLERICIKHLRATLRVAVSFDTLDHVWILLIGHHDNQRPDRDVYTMLYRMANVAVPTATRDKPPCCDASGEPPLYDDAELLATRCECCAELDGEQRTRSLRLVWLRGHRQAVNYLGYSCMPAS